MSILILDIETVALEEKSLLEMMPDDLRNPRMPEDVANPALPDFTKCPVYSGDKIKQQAWIEKTQAEWEQKNARAKSDWNLKASEARQRWMEDAALHAPRSTVKIIGLRNVEKQSTHLLLVDVTPEERKRIEAEKTWPCKVIFSYLTEKEALNHFYEVVAAPNASIQLIGFWIRHFDFRFLLRRSMIVGAKVCRQLIKNFQYFNESIFTDISDCYLMGERELKVGGLDGLAVILGVKRKVDTGENFGALWKENPANAILYHLHELDTIEQCARKMRAIQ